MKFLVYSPALNGSEEIQSLVDRLVDRVADEVHRLELVDSDGIKGSKWYQGARNHRRRIVLSAAAGPPQVRGTRGPHSKVITVDDDESVRMAEKLAHSPLIILVEDRESDGILLDILIEKLGWPELQVLWSNGAPPPAVRIESAGGIGNMPLRIDRYTSDPGRRWLRLIVICDSDFRWPNDEGSSTGHELRLLRRKCDQHGLKLVVLRKRSAENYIPDAVIDELRNDPRTKPEDVERFEALLGLKPTQRDYFPVKTGLSPEERRKATEARLYEPEDEPRLRILETLKLPGRKRPLRILAEDHRSAFTKEGLCARAGDGELELLLEQIADEL